MIKRAASCLARFAAAAGGWPADVAPTSLEARNAALRSLEPLHAAAAAPRLVQRLVLAAAVDCLTRPPAAERAAEVVAC